jgi:hypothetical protein
MPLGFILIIYKPLKFRYYLVYCFIYSLYYLFSVVVII